VSDALEITEVGPRDGLQSEDVTLAPTVRAALVNQLARTGVRTVEAAAFMSAARVPQMGEPEAVLASVDVEVRSLLTALVATPVGCERAIVANLGHVRMVVAASDAMNHANFGRSTSRSLQGLARMAELVRNAGLNFGVVIGTSFGCPYEGDVPASRVLGIAAHAADLGADEVVLADTTGMASPETVARLGRAGVSAGLPRLGVHLHNTRNTGYANAVRALDAGVRRFDASVGGTGGCPFAPGAAGNVATEDLVHMFHGMGLETGVDLDRLLDVARWLRGQLRHELPGQLLVAGPSVTAATAGAR
jgi:isopropylmalate/homocitrate/citramalate synthase